MRDHDIQMLTGSIPERLIVLHEGEEHLWRQALGVATGDARMVLHLIVIEQAMDLADLLRQHETADEDLKVVQMLGMRVFNAFGASLKLAMSGYGQNAALIMRDILETVFLLDLFRGDRTTITRWRFADKRERMKQFSPVRVREALDSRDGFTGKKRAEMYEMFSELAGHPNMHSVLMMRPRKDGNAHNGPFIEADSLRATLDEMGRLACQFGEILVPLFPAAHAPESRRSFTAAKMKWFSVFYGNPKVEGA